jgi:hypothetical protein
MILLHSKKNPPIFLRYATGYGQTSCIMPPFSKLVLINFPRSRKLMSTKFFGLQNNRWKKS